MIQIKKIIVNILIKEDPENICAKCCKTMQVIERMLTNTSIFKDKVEIKYMDVGSNKAIERYGNFEPPTIFINDKLFSQGHVPIIKKLGKKLLKMLKN